MKYTITTLLLAGVAVLAFGGQTTTPTAQQDLTYELAYDNGIDGTDPAKFDRFGSGSLQTRYSAWFNADWTDCEQRQKVGCVKVRICPPPASYTGKCEIYLGNAGTTAHRSWLWPYHKDFAIMTGVWWHTICFDEENILVTSGTTKIWARIGLVSGTAGNVMIIRDSDGKSAYASRQHMWDMSGAYPYNPVQDAGLGTGSNPNGDLMIRLNVVKQDVEVKSVWLEPSGPYNVGQTVTLKARLVNNDEVDRGNMTVKASFTKSGVTLTNKVVDFDPALDVVESWTFTVPTGWKNTSGIKAKVQIVTTGYEWFTANDVGWSDPFNVNPLIDAGCTGISIPTATVTAGVECRPKVTFKNYGQTTQSIPVKWEVWNEDNTVKLWDGAYTWPDVPAGVSKTYQWPTGSGFTPSAGNYQFKCYTALSGDQVPSNDAKSKSFTAVGVLKDAGVVRISSPAGTIPRGEGVDVTVVVENFGNTEVTFPVKCELTINGRRYHYSQSVENLGIGETREVTFVDRRFRQVGDWTVKSWTELEGDPNGQNNTVEQPFQVTGAEGWYVSYGVPGTVPVNKGAAMASDGANFFLVKGKKDGQVYSFADDLDQPSVAGTMPLQAGLGTQLAYVDGFLYVLTANKTFGFYAVNLEDGQWTQLANLPEGLSGKPARNGASMAVANGMIYVLKGNKTSEMYRFNPALGTWETMSDIPGVVKDGAALVSDGNRLYAVPGNKSSSFYTFDGSAWQRLADLPAKAKAGTVLGYLNGVVYVALGGGTSFYGYDPLMNVWNQLQEVPKAVDNKKVGPGSAMTTVDGAVLLVKKAKSPYILAYAPESYFCSSRQGAEGVQASGSALKSAVTVANPVRNVLRVNSTLPAPVSIQLYTSSGSLVKTLTSARSGGELGVAGLASGTYLLRVSSGSQTITRQVVIQ